MSEEMLSPQKNLSAAKQLLLEKRLKGKGKTSSPAPAIKRRENRELAAVSYPQERMWFVNQLQPESAAYNVPGALRLTGEVDVAALKKSIDEIIRRHDVLRTTFRAVDGRLVQIIEKEMQFDWRVDDLRHFPQEKREEERIRAEAEMACLSFALDQGPLIGMRLLRVADDEHILLLTVHHIIFDGWSIGIFVRELASLYRAYSKGEEASLPELVIQYGDYAEWQRNVWLEQTEMDKQLSYWREKLKGMPAALDLPTDRVRPPVQTFRGAAKTFALPADLKRRLEALGRQEGATLFMTLLAAFKTLVYRYSGQSDLVIGTPIAGRKHRETESLIGLFLNLLALRTDVSGELSFRDLLRRVKQVTLEAYANQDIPFEKLVEELKPERDLSRHPLFQAMFVLQNAPVPSLEWEELRIEIQELETGTAKFDLNVWMTETAEGLTGTWEYNTDLFDEQTIVQMAGHFENILRTVADDADQKLAELPILTDRDLQVLQEWATGPQVEMPETTIHELIEARSAETPDRIALVFRERQMTYADLDAEANRLAHYILERSAGTDPFIGVYLERSLEMVIALLAVLKANRAYVPIDPEYPEERIRYMLEDSRVSLILTQSRLRESLPAGIDAICLDRDRRLWTGMSPRKPEGTSSPDQEMYMIYTSGSTGKPKGVINNHRGVVNRLLWMQQEYRLTEGDRVLQKTPFSFDVSVWEFFWPLLAGAQLVIAEPGGHRDSSYLVRLIQEQQITTLHFVPSMLQIFLEHPESSRCTSLQRVICSGEALTAQLQKAFYERLDAGLYNLYGPTEAAVDVTEWKCQKHDPNTVVPIGYPISNTRILVLDARLQPVPIGVVGELHIGGVQVAKGYHNRPELTAERFIPDPFSSEPGARLYKTGDLARFRWDGSIEYMGRMDNQVKLRGLRIELDEIAATLEQHKDVRQAVVLVRDASPEDKRLEAYLLLEKNAAAWEAKEWRDYLKKRLPEYMVPGRFIAVEEMPLTANGKLDRGALLKMAGEPVLPQEAYVAPRNAVEEVLAEIWRDVLGTERVGVHDDFFELGGHSLLATQIATRVAQVLHSELPLIPFFHHPTVAGAAELILQDPLQRTRIEKTAQLLVNLSRLSEEEVDALLLESSTTKGGRDA
ncbi:amino acid adenylation domain-containing protein [Brevibacillus composti]|uniref:Amino acid adenylation domain-containing protein n=1 Tax=Brevibacillus composti TaxID=2796470 RepID=A0A7T5EHN5_9BACL|nr:non-ribosomal peptide synthetase [Brevibacillus composti]QQE72804.1 amino acid adenylation domain-containing protein [Brevibacillus composti]QUO39882.1 amino acid adenylation domain-containing protein [Brevibacillus composti]